jgi:hypothetical protein
MSFRFNPFTGTLDIVGTSTSSSGVTGPVVSTDNAIAVYNGTTGQVIKNSLAIVQLGGAVQAQAFLADRQILNDITVPNHYTMMQTDVFLISGDIILDGDSTLLLL